MKRGFILSLIVGVVCLLARTAMAQTMEDSAVYKKIGRGLANLYCPDLGVYYAARAEIRAIFDREGKPKKEWVEYMTQLVARYSDGEAAFLEDEDDKSVFLPSPHAHFLVKRGDKSLKYIIIAGEDQIACEKKERF